MSRKSAPPRRVSSDTGRTRAERGKKRATERNVRAGATRRARATGCRKKGERRAARQKTEPGNGTADRFPSRRQRRTVNARARERSERGAVEGARGPTPPPPRRTGPRWRARGARDEATRAQTRRESRDTANHDGWPGPGRQLGRALPNGAAARRGDGAPRAQQRNDATTAAGTEPRRTTGGDTRPQARPSPSPSPLTESGKAERDGQSAAAAEETRRPPPPPRAGKARGKGAAADGVRGRRGHRGAKPRG